MNFWSWFILFIAILLAVVGFASSIMSIYSYFEAHRHPKIKQPPRTITIIYIAILFLLAIILTPISRAIGKITQPITATATDIPIVSATVPTATKTITVVPTPTPTLVTPSLSSLYQADFTQGSQRWLETNNTQQWTYNTSDKALESDGSAPCCTPTTELQDILLLAPYMIQANDYVIEARIRVTGLSSIHRYTNDQPPFFGLYARGDTVNGKGYMAGIGWIYGTPTGRIGTDGPLSYLIALGSNPQFYNTVDQGAEKYGLDTAWHTYRFEVKGEMFMLKIDNKVVYSHPIQDNMFSSGTGVGIENYNCLLQVQSFVIYPL